MPWMSVHALAVSIVACTGLMPLQSSAPTLWGLIHVRCEAWVWALETPPNPRQAAATAVATTTLLRRLKRGVNDGFSMLHHPSPGGGGPAIARKRRPLDPLPDAANCISAE